MSGFAHLNPVVLKWLRRWRHDPIRMGRDLFKFEPTNQQAALMRDANLLTRAKLKAHYGHPMSEQEIHYSKKRGISIRSGKGTGKNGVMSVLMYWKLLCFHKPKIPCTAPTQAQLDTNLWSELSKWMNQVDPKTGKRFNPLRSVFDLKSRKLHLVNDVYNGKEWYAVGRTAQKTASDEEQARTLQGFHADNMMVVIDEGSGVANPVFRPFDTTLTGRNNWLMLAFNPNSRSGFAAKTHLDPKESYHWILHHWNAEECPLVGADHLEYMAKKYGRDSDMYRVNVLGEFPQQESGAVIPWEWVYMAVQRDIHDGEIEGYPLHMGIDPGAGGDPSVAVIRRGPKVLGFWENMDTRTDDVVDWAMSLISRWSPDKIFIDKAGIGHGVFSYVKRYVGHGVIGVNAGRGAFDKDKFFGLRDQLWWRMREAFEDCMDIPDHEDLIVELSTPKYDSENKIKVDKKGIIREQIGRSTNYADALAYTYYHDAKYDIKDKVEDDVKYRSRNYWDDDDDDDNYGPLSWMSL